MLRFSGRHLERSVKRAIARLNTQRRIENEKWLAHGVDNILRVRFDLPQISFGSSSLGYVFHSENEDRVMASCAKLAAVEQHHATSNVGESMLELEVVKNGARRN